MKKTLLIVGLIVVIGALAWWLVSLFTTPLKFEEQRKEREVVVVRKLEDIRTAQRAYRSKYMHFTPSFDELIAFVERDSLQLERAIGSEDDSVAVAQGLVRREKFMMAVKDTIKFNPGFVAAQMRYIPFSEESTGSLKEFQMDTTSIQTESTVVVPVFQALAPYAWFLGDLNEQELINFRDYRVNSMKRDDGLKVGSLTATNNEAGNWE